MRRGTTTFLTLQLPGIEPDQIKSLHVTLSSAGKMLDKTLNDDGVTLTDEGVRLMLSQADTLRLTPGVIKIQVRGLTLSDVAFATKIKSKWLDDILLDREIE